MKRGLVVAIILLLGVNLQFALSQEGQAASCTSIHTGAASDGESVDITFVGDAGVPAATIRRVAEDFFSRIQTNLPPTHPYNEFRQAGKLDIRAVTESADLSCCTSGTNPCNPARAAQLASACPTDEIVVISNKINELNCQRARVLGTYGVHALVSPNAAPREIFHELGKSLAFLGEESLYEGEVGEYDPLIADFEANQDLYRNQLQIFNFPNCEKKPQCDESNNCLCPKWQCTGTQREDNPDCGIQDAECIAGCGFPEYRRDADDDIMRRGSVTSALEEIHIRNALARYLTSSSISEPISIEINKPAEDLFIQNFLEVNREGHAGIIPEAEFDVPVPPEVPTPDTNFWEEVVDFASPFNPFCDNFLNFGGLDDFECGKPERITNFAPAELKLTFTDIEREPTSSPDTVKTTFRIRADINGKVKYRAAGGFSVNCILPPVSIDLDCEDDLPEIPWSTSFLITVETEMRYSQAPTGVVRVEPRITRIIRPQDPGIRVRDPGTIQLDALGGAPQDFLNFVRDVILAEDDAPAYAFATETDPSLCPEGTCLASHLERNFDDIGSAFKFSTDTFGTGDYPNTHEPRNLFFDFFVAPVSQDQPSAIEIEEQQQADERGTRLRLSGQALMNLPLASEKAECIRDISHNFKNALALSDSDRNTFERQINLDPERHGNMKVSENYLNQHIANLWNRGHLCTESEVPILNFPITFDDFTGTLINLKKITYSLIPQRPYYIAYSDTGDSNGDGVVNFEDEIISRGDIALDMVFVFEGPDATSESDDVALGLRIDQAFTAPLTLEEPDISQADLAQSFLKSEVENIDAIDNNIGECIGGTEGLLSDQCTVLRNNILFRPCDFEPCPLPGIDIIKDHIKESYTAPQISRGLAEAPILPVRDVSRQLGVVADYFNPGISLNLGNYIHRIQQTQIDGKYGVFAYDLVPKCAPGEDCGPASRAFINSIEDIYFKNSQSCMIDQACIEPGCFDAARECLDNLMLAPGDLHHYYKINYDSRDDFVSYNYNLRSWNPYTLTDRSHLVYLTESQATADALVQSKETGSGGGNVENIDPNAEVNVHSISWLDQGTTVLAVRSRTAKGVEQNLECMHAARIDQDCNNFANS